MSKILIIDDDMLGVRPLEWILRDMEHQVLKAAEGLAGLTTLKEAAKIKKNFDLVIIDLYMPTMGGKKLLKAIRNNKQIKNIKVLIRSSVREEDIDEKTLKKADGYLDKAANPATIIETVNGLLK